MSDLRLDLIGCSDLPALLGLDAYTGELELWLRIVHDIHPPKPDAVRELADLGTDLEEGIARAYVHREHGRGVLFDLVKPPSRPQPAGLDWLRYSLDPIAIFDPSFRRPELLEVKHREFRSWKAQGFTETEPSLAIRAQVQGQLACLALDNDFDEAVGRPLRDAIDGATAVVLVGRKIYSYRIDRDLELGTGLLSRAAEWWDRYVETETPPPIDGSKGAGWALRALHPSGPYRPPRPAEEADLELRDEARALADAIDRDEALLEERRGDLQVLKNQIAERCADADGIKNVAMWRTARGRVSWKALASDLVAQAGLTRDQVAALEEKHRGQPRRDFVLLE